MKNAIEVYLFFYRTYRDPIIGFGRVKSAYKAIKKGDVMSREEQYAQEQCDSAKSDEQKELAKKQYEDKNGQK